MTDFKELSSAVELALDDGRINPAAVGWARRGAHTTHNLPSGLRAAAELFRTKRWEYWGITGPDLVLGLTVANIGYAAVLQVYIHQGGKTFTDELVRPAFLSDVVLPDTAPPFAAHGSWGGASLDFVESPDGKTFSLVAKSAHLDCALTVDYASEHLSTAFQISDTRYMYTVKAPALPVTGRLKIDGEDVPLENTWATLDRGRGRWPYGNVWNWGVAQGVNADGRRVGLNCGAGWTDHAGTTENAVVVDGVLDGPPRTPAKWTFDKTDFLKPWTVRGDWIDATFTPTHHRHAENNSVVVTSHTDQCFGAWSGTVTLHDGTKIKLDGLHGWAEDVTNWW